MGTFLFDQIVFGPVASRRLGKSLGINILPTTRKVCSFNCIYCECGWNPEKPQTIEILPELSVILQAMEERFKLIIEKGEEIDIITFAGNGEPTLHPNFDKIIDGTISLRNSYLPGVKIAVLSNATCLHIPKVTDSLKKIDLAILKLDSANEATIKLINQPGKGFNINRLIQQLKEFKNQLVIQTLFMKGTINGHEVDNTTENELEAWYRLIQELKPRLVMIYTIQRDTPLNSLQPVSLKVLNQIADRLKSLTFEVSISG